MYLHQVIDQITFNYKTCVPALKSTYSYYLNSIVPKLKESVCFHLDDMASIVNMMKKISIVPSFYERKIPFNKCWFDFVDKDDKYSKSTDTVIKDGFIFTNKRAVYCEEFCNNVLLLLCFNYATNKHEWRCVPIEVFISTNETSLDKNEEFIKKTVGLEGYIFHQLEGKVVFRYIPNQKTVFALAPGNFTDQQLTDLFAEDMSIYFGFLLTSLNLLQCKNIVTVNNYPPSQLNKKKSKNCKEPLHIFKTLMVKPIIKKLTKNESSTSASQGLMKLHIAMGHFKNYTEDRPLFGKHVGKFWWQPQVRGNVENGTVTKDYQLLTT